MVKTRRRPPSSEKQARPRRKPNFRKKPPPWHQRYPWLPWALGLGVVAIVIIALGSGRRDAPAPGESVSRPTVGADLHSLAVDPNDPDTIYVGSHQGVSVSSDRGATWEVVESLEGADAMGWAFTDNAILVGGHPGLMVSTDGGETFEPRNDELPSTDVHALGAGKNVIYAGVAGAGTLASTDGGTDWETRSEEVGGALMGRIVVDPTDDEHVLAPDMGRGVMESSDGGRSWRSLGGVPAAMWVTWDGSDPDHIIATTQGAAAETTDGGDTWNELQIPEGASIVEFSPDDPKILYAAVLQDPNARVFVSRDGGQQWDEL